MQRGKHVEPHYFRTSDGHEIDLVFENDGELWAIETKLTTSPSSEDMARLNKAADLIGARYRVLVSRTTRSVVNETQASCSLDTLLSHDGNGWLPTT